MAAGKGTRMKSNRPKVLHRLGGRALLGHVVDTAGRLGARHVIVVTGHGADEVEAALAGWSADRLGADAAVARPAVAASDAVDSAGPDSPVLTCVRQMPQLGTGHAVQQAAPA